jgi:hypothetical protein
MMAVLSDGSIESAKSSILESDLSDWQRRAVSTSSGYFDLSWEMMARAAKLIYFSLIVECSMCWHMALTIIDTFLFPLL